MTNIAVNTNLPGLKHFFFKGCLLLMNVLANINTKNKKYPPVSLASDVQMRSRHISFSISTSKSKKTDSRSGGFSVASVERVIIMDSQIHYSPYYVIPLCTQCCDISKCAQEHIQIPFEHIRKKHFLWEHVLKSQYSSQDETVSGLANIF